MPEPSAEMLARARAIIGPFRPGRFDGHSLVNKIALALDATGAERERMIDADFSAHRHDGRWPCSSACRWWREEATALRELAAAERRVIEACLAVRRNDHNHAARATSALAIENGPLAENLERELSEAVDALALVATADQPPAQPHDHNGNCRWRRSIVHTPGEEQATT